MTHSSQPLPLISIGIATFNRAETLRRALESLMGLKKSDKFQTEVVVIDNGSTDHTALVVSECAQLATERNIDMTIRHIVEPKAGLPFARNRAVAEARGSWVAFFDDDQLAAEDWLIRLFTTATEKHAECVGGARSLRIETDNPPVLHLFCRYLLGEIDVREPQAYHRKFLPCTGNVLIKKSVFETVGVFDETVLDGGEDSDFFNRVIDHGVVAYYEPEANVEHLISANRLEKSYLSWIAFRHGLHVGRRDLLQRGRVAALLLLAGRWLHTTLTVLPRLMFAKVRQDVAGQVGLRCRIERVIGYTRYVMSGGRSDSLLLSKTMHRGKG